MNTALNLFLEHVTAYTLKKKNEFELPHMPSPQSTISQSAKKITFNHDAETTTSTLLNMSKAKKNLSSEFDRLQARVEVVSNPSYQHELKQKLAEADKQIKQAKQEKKQMLVNRIKNEKRMDRIIQSGEPEGMKEVNMNQKNLDKMKEKLKQID